MPVLLLLQMDVPFLERWITFSCLWGKGLLLFAASRAVVPAAVGLGRGMRRAPCHSAACVFVRCEQASLS